MSAYSHVMHPVSFTGDDHRSITFLENYIAVHGLFRNKRLSVAEVAVAINIPVKTLSDLINRHYQQRFTDWLNTYRVNYIIVLLKTEGWNKYKIEFLGEQAGFSSRSAFFSVFKKTTGFTPLGYISTLPVSGISPLGVPGHPDSPIFGRLD